jgi:prephenate dehydratase
MGVNVAYPGRDGAHSAAACDNLFPSGTELVPLPSFTAVVAATADGEVAFGVLPIESSLTGPVNETHDLLYESPLSITGETVLPIRHCLVGPKDVPLDEIRIVRSHPAALDQCRRLLAAMPWTTAIAAATTADAASEVSERGDPTEAAIASERAARMYGLTVIAGDVGDHPEAETWRTAFSFATDHRPGALHKAIEPFGRHSLDLVQLVSRPIPSTPWRYRFDAVLAGHPLDSIVTETLAEVQGLTRELRVFGSYPAYT